MIWQAACDRIEGRKVNLIWRFYRGEDKQWRWQQLSAGREVVADSPAAHADYELCLADARKQGYVFQNSQVGHKPRR